MTIRPTAPDVNSQQAVRADLLPESPFETFARDWVTEQVVDAADHHQALKKNIADNASVCRQVGAMGAMSERPLFPLFDLPAWMKQRGVCRKPEDIGPAQKQVTGDGVVRFVGADLPPCSGTDPWLRPKTKAPPGHEV